MPNARPVRRRLFRKYLLLLVGLVVAALLASGVPDAWLTYEEAKSALVAVQQARAETLALRIGQFVNGIVDEIGWATRPQWAASAVDQRSADLVHLLERSPAIVEISQLDDMGKEQLKASRIAGTNIGSLADRSQEQSFVGARVNRYLTPHSGGGDWTRPGGMPWFSPIYSRDSELFMTIAVAGSRRNAGVIVAEVSLKAIWDIIVVFSGGRSGAAPNLHSAGYAYLVDREGRLIAHHDIGLVLNNTNLAGLPQIAAAIADAPASRQPSIAQGPDGQTVLTAHAGVVRPGWIVFVDRPLSEALAPAYASLRRTAMLLVIGLIMAGLAALVLARRMVVPIRALEKGAARIGAGQFNHRITIATGDELERLADRFNQMAGELALSQERSERIARLKRFLSPQVAEIVENAGVGSLLDARSADVVVVFCDLRGFTDFSGRVEPEEIMHVIGEYYAAVGASITHHQATLTHFAGDGLMMLLNAPLRCPDDPVLRAVRMAKDIQAAVQSLIVSWGGRGHAMGFGIGLARGIATVGRVGYEERHDYTAIGNVVNLAARLCSTAENGQILIDAAAAATITDTTALQLLGTRPLKGFAAPVPIYAVS